jgi:hypothetical protein
MENVSEISRNQKSAKFRELSYREISYPPYKEFYHIHDSLMLDDPISSVSRSPVLFFNGDFCMNLYSVDSYKAMKRLTVHRFNFQEALNASSPLILTKNHRLTLYHRYFFKQIHRLTFHCC